MIHNEQSVILSKLLEHISTQRVRAKLTDQPFDLGIATDTKESQVLPIIRDEANMKLLQDIGLQNYIWHNDALRSSLMIAGENLLVSICRPR